MRRFISLFLLFALTATPTAHSSSLNFSVHKLDSGVPGNTILIVGGIQGDEPGGFNAASIITTATKALVGFLVTTVVEENSGEAVEVEEMAVGEMEEVEIETV